MNYNQDIASNGTFAEMQVLQTVMGAGVELTDRLSVGFLGMVGSAAMDGIFSNISSSTPAYNSPAPPWVSRTSSVRQRRSVVIGIPSKNLILSTLCGSAVQVNHSRISKCRCRTSMGLESPMSRCWMANCWSRSTSCISLGRTPTFSVRFGTTNSRCKPVFNTRPIEDVNSAGPVYDYADNTSRDIVAPSFGPITPQAGVDYVQALFPNINQHRISGGIGLTDVLPGVDLDLFAGGMFGASQTFGRLLARWKATGLVSERPGGSVAVAASTLSARPLVILSSLRLLVFVDDFAHRLCTPRSGERY